MKSKSTRQPLPLLLALLGALLLLPACAEAKKKHPATPSPTPPPQNEAPADSGPPTQAPPSGIGAVDERLWHQQTGEAREVLGRYLDQADSNAYVATAYGRVLEQEKNYGDATTKLRHATDLAPGDPAPWVYLGEVYLRQRRQGDADAAFRHAIDAASSGGGGESAYYLGVAQQRLRQYDAAVATLQGASGPSPALVPYQIGVTRAFQQNWSAAVDQLSEAIGMDSGLAYAYYYRGLAQDKLGHKDQLIADMERFLALAPNAPEAEQARSVMRASGH